MVHVGILGATGYAGLELTRILLQHPEVDKLSASSVSFEGKSLEDVYPSMVNRQNDTVLPELKKAEDVIAAADVVFLACPTATPKKRAISVYRRLSPSSISLRISGSVHMRISSKSGMAPAIPIQNCTLRLCMGSLSCTARP